MSKSKFAVPLNNIPMLQFATCQYFEILLRMPSSAELVKLIIINYVIHMCISLVHPISI